MAPRITFRNMLLGALLTQAAPDAMKAQTSAESVLSAPTQGRFQPLTQRQRAERYAKGLISPLTFVTAGASAGIGQWRDTPHEWGQGAEGYGRRYASSFGTQAVSRTLCWGGEAALHEDNRYFSSGKDGIWARTRYAMTSSVLARHDNGNRYLSVSRLGSTAGAALLSRTWQPSNSNAAISIGVSLGSTAGMNIMREFLPDILRKVRRQKR